MTRGQSDYVFTGYILILYDSVYVYILDVGLKMFICIFRLKESTFDDINLE